MQLLSWGSNIETDSESTAKRNACEGDWKADDDPEKRKIILWSLMKLINVNYNVIKPSDQL